MQSPPSTKDRAGRKRLARDRPQLGDGSAVPGHGQAFTSGDAIDDLAAMVSELADRDFCHADQCITRETSGFPCASRGPGLES